MNDSKANLIQLSTDRLGDLGPIASAPAHKELEAVVQSVRKRTGPGSEYFGWLDLPKRRGEEFERMLECAKTLRSDVEFLVVVGIGGSYLGTRAILDAMEPALDSQDGPIVLFAGHHLEPSSYKRLLDNLEGTEVAVNVISKSGTTTEPALAFRLLKAKLEDMYGAKKARTRIVATTDASRGALRTLAEEEGYETFVVPDDVGGRFSVLSPVGLFPLAVAGVDIEGLLTGAAAEADRCHTAKIMDMPAARYAAARYDLYQRGMQIEVWASFFPSLHMVSEWWKQLFGESEGKEQGGLFPASVSYTTDLHSMGQYMQQGRRHMLETFVDVANPMPGPSVEATSADLDGLNYLAGRSVADINRVALEAVAQAHEDGGVPNMTVTLPYINPPSLGSLMFFFEYAAAVSGRLLGVNPFDQPGVEAYKANLFKLLGKPGA